MTRNDKPGSRDLAAGSPAAVQRRLYGLKAAAAYLDVSRGSVSDWIRQGLIPTVQLPPLRTLEGDRPRTTHKRVLIDKVDLDRFVEQHKSARDSGTCAPQIEADKHRANSRTVPTVCPPEVAKCGH